MRLLKTVTSYKMFDKSSGVKVGGLKCPLKFRILTKVSKMYNFLTVIWLTTAKFGPLSWQKLHTPDINHCLYIFGPKVAGSCVMGFEPGTFRFLLQRLNPFGHSPRVPFRHPDKNFASKTKFQVNPK